MVLSLASVLGASVLGAAVAAGITAAAVVAGAALGVICVLSAIARLRLLVAALDDLD